MLQQNKRFKSRYKKYADQEAKLSQHGLQTSEKNLHRSDLNLNFETASEIAQDKT